jgi:hypothetical protein
MGRARDIANILSSSTALATDSELASFNYLTQGSASSTYTPLSSPVIGFKNKIINGSMRFWQRGTSFTTPAGVYTADRYKVTQNATSGTYVASRQTASLDGFQYCMRLQRSSGQTATGAIIMGHALESIDVIPLQGKSVVFSFYARKGSNFSSSSNTITVQVFTGTGTDGQSFAALTNEVNHINQTPTLTDSWQRFTYTFNIPSNASEFRFNIFYLPTGTASTNDYFDITGIQLEIGNIVTDFEHKSFANELQMCERYYELCIGGYYDGNVNSGSFYGGATNFRTAKRATPTVTRISEVVDRIGNTPYSEHINAYGFRSMSQANSSLIQWTTLYRAEIEL